MSYTEKRPKTIFSDIDGTLVEHISPFKSTNPNHKMKLLPGTLEKLQDWDMKGYYIILTMYDQLVMGIGGGIRVLINDTKPYGDFNTAESINLNRNEGIKNIKI